MSGAHTGALAGLPAGLLTAAKEGMKGLALAFRAGGELAPPTLPLVAPSATTTGTCPWLLLVLQLTACGVGASETGPFVQG